MKNLCRTPLVTLAAALALLLASALSAEEPLQAAPEDQGAIIAVIKSQLAAFKRDDSVEAFSYAAPVIRQRFGDHETFMTMVKSGYGVVYRPLDVEFLDSRIRDGVTGQAVRFYDRDGGTSIAIYTMERQPDGTWRISGVYLVPTDETTS